MVHMPRAVKYSSQNQSGLFFPLAYDQVAGKGIIQKHRECPTVHSKNEKKRTRTGKVEKAMIYEKTTTISGSVTEPISPQFINSAL